MRELGRDVLDARGVVAALGEVAHRGLEDARALGLGAGSREKGRGVGGGSKLCGFHDWKSAYLTTGVEFNLC